MKSKKSPKKLPIIITIGVSICILFIVLGSFSLASKGEDSGIPIDLMETSYAASPEYIGEGLLTNSEQIHIYTGEEGQEITLYLYDADDRSNYIQEITLNADTNRGVFENLSSSGIYYVLADQIHDDSAIITLSSEPNTYK